MSQRRDVAVMLLVLGLLIAPAAGALTGPSHTASSGVTYQTNSGLEVTLTDEREIAASPFAGDETFASDGLEISSPGPSAVSVSNQAWDGETMAVREIDASSNPITLRRDDISNDVTVAGGTTDIIVHNVTLDDGAVDLEVVANSQTNITVAGLPDVGAIQAVDESGDTVASADTETGALTLDAGTYKLRLQEAPDTLTIRDLTTGELVKNGSELNVTLEFFGNDGFVETRETTDATIDTTGLPVDQRFSVTVDAGDGYVQRQVIIPSILDQQTIWLLPDSPDIPTVTPRFRIEDPTNQFDPERTEIVFKRPITLNGTTEFRAVAGDRVGLNGFDTTLAEGQRYRVVITDPESGARRTLGEYTATTTELVTFTVEDVEFDSVSDVDGIDWTARYITNEESSDQIEFIFRDDEATQSLEYRIYERGNASNVLVDASATGNVTVTETVPPGEGNTVWVVEWNTTRTSGETLSGARQVSSDSLPTDFSLDPQWQTIIAMIGLFAVAGLFGAVNPGIGGIGVAATGGMFYLIGWLPDSTGGIMVILALFVAVLAFVGRRARGATA